MELKIWCDKCKGFKWQRRNDKSDDLIECTKCGGKGYTNPPQQVLDDLECAEIERELIAKGCIITKLSNYLANGKVYEISVFSFEHKEGIKLYDENLVAMLRKFKAWLDEKDGE